MHTCNCTTKETYFARVTFSDGQVHLREVCRTCGGNARGCSVGDKLSTMKTEKTDFLFRVETTKVSTAQRESKKWPVQLCTTPSIDSERTWIFPDGSGTGWHAAVIVRAGIGEHRIARCNGTTGNNVAEFDAVILGLEHSRSGESIVIVSDQLRSAYYVNGWWKAHDDRLRERVEKARMVLKQHRLSNVLFIHHPGHQEDDCDFSNYNRIADQLCGQRRLANLRIPWPHGQAEGS